MPHVPFETLSDDELHGVVRRLTARSNMALADLLAHLGEVEARGIHRSRACATLYTYCLYELRMSEDAAYRRSKAARLVREHPGLREVLARGEIHLTGLLMIAPYLGGERHAEIFERARFRSKREIARLIAEIDPKPEVPARIEPVAAVVSRRPTMQAFAESLAGPVRSLPEGDRPADWIEPDGDPSGDAGGVQDSALQDLSEAECALEGAWQARHGAHAERPSRYKVQFTATQEYVDLLEEALDLLGYKKKATRLPEVQLRALRELVERLRKQRRGAPAREAVVGAAPARVAETTERADEPRTAAPVRFAGPTERAPTRGDEPRTAAPAVVGAAPARVAETTERAPARSDEPRTAAPVGVGAAPAREAVVGAAPARESQRPRPTHGRHVPVAVRRAVWARDASQCAYVDERGRRCLERGGLELHHREAHAFGGPATEHNLELRCRAHNILAAEHDFGRAYMDRVRGT